MLCQLSIRQLGLIEAADVEFGPGLQVITGETGVGKSMLLRALEVLCGSRARADWVRTGQDEARVAGFFELSAGLQAAIEERSGLTGLEDGLRVERRWRTKGRARVLLNGEEHSLHTLRSIGDLLVQIHGQRAQLSLLTPSWQLDALDRYADLVDDRAKYREEYVAARELHRQLTDERADDRERADRRRYLEHVVQELEEAQLKPGERREIERELELLERRDQIFATIGRAIETLNEREESPVADEIGTHLRDLTNFASIDGRIASAVESLEAAEQHIADAVRDLTDFENDIDLDPSRLDSLRKRHDELQRLEERYHRDTDELCDYLETNRAELEDLENRDERRPEREAELAARAAKVEKLAAALSKKRRTAARRLAKQVASSLADLALEAGALEFELLPVGGEGAASAAKRVAERVAEEAAATSAGDDASEPGASEVGAAEAAASDPLCGHDDRGRDRCEISFAPNQGEPSRPLRDIASGGELSRVLLALESTLAAKSETPLLVFDEVDTGVGGRLGSEIGRKLQAIGALRQVLCVTHLPQVAGFARDHFRVVKQVNSKRTVTTVVPLAEEERVEELAAMLRGGERGARSLEEARTMLRPTASATKR